MFRTLLAAMADELTRLEGEFNRSQAMALDAENKELMQEIKRLRAEIKRLQAASAYRLARKRG